MIDYMSLMFNGFEPFYRLYIFPTAPTFIKMSWKKDISL